MFTVVETLIFQRTWPHYWTEEERGEFCAYIATNHEVGDVVAQSGGVRKVRCVLIRLAPKDATGSVPRNR